MILSAFTVYILKCCVSANAEQQLTWWLSTHLIKTTNRTTVGRRRLRREGDFREGGEYGHMLPEGCL